MMNQPKQTERRFFVPEVVQTSAMDCGPASLKSILEGFNISVSYGRLREACQTDVDGTSIDTMEEIARQLGLEAEQVMVPADHLLLPESGSLPAIVVVRLPNGFTHFVVVWNLYGPFIQVMDPSSGRHWFTRQQFLSELYIHTQPVPTTAWREWASSDGFCDPLRHRLGHLGAEPTQIERWLNIALQDQSWYSLAALDATTRLVTMLVHSKGLQKGVESVTVLERFFQGSLNRNQKSEELEHSIPSSRPSLPFIPDSYWSVQPAPNTNEETLLLRGAVLVRVLGHRSKVDMTAETEPAPLSPELVAALTERPLRPEWEIWRLIRADGLLTPSMLLWALEMATVNILIQAFLLRGILDVGSSLDLIWQRIGAVAAFFAFLIAMFLLEIPITTTVQRIGRRLETRLRIAFLEKIPRLSDHYFRSRLTSDMTQRAHELRQLRNLPELAANFLRLNFQMVFTTFGVIWLDPISAPLAILITVFAIGISLASQPILMEQDLRLRTHKGALSNFYLDALLGLIPIRTHGAERAIRREHESLLVEWFRSFRAFYRTNMFFETIQAVMGLVFSVLILFNYLAKGGSVHGILLLFYWTLNLPILGTALANITKQYPLQRNMILRLLEPLGAPEEEVTEPASFESPKLNETPKTTGGIAISMVEVTVHAGGHTILSDINLNLKSGEHIAIVGSSGAGKSSLVGLLLGWYRAAGGQVLIDGAPLNSNKLELLRQQTAWIDPSVQLWNRTLLENLRYGNNEAITDLPIEQANLFSVLEKLPNGLQTILGEGGGLVSGGEGQRVRLGRAMARPGVRLVIMDEPFRGLDRAQRRELLTRARQHWHDATLIFISHDVSEAQNFERVLVIEQGQLVEDDAPSALIAHPDSRYLALLQAEEAVHKGMWKADTWRRLRLENGQVHET